MIILTIDTSSTSASTAILNEGIILSESSVTLADIKGNGRKTHSETLMPMIEGLFNITAMHLSEIDIIAATCGPGSFTGLRIGAATAKGLAYAAKKPLIAVPALDALAGNITAFANTVIVPMLDARRAQIYTALYRVRPDLSLERVTDYLAADICDIINEYVMPIRDRIIFLGEGAYANKAYLSGLNLGIVAPSYNSRIQMSSVGAYAIKQAKAGNLPDEGSFNLLYIRKPQAERELEKRLLKNDSDN